MFSFATDLLLLPPFERMKFYASPYLISGGLMGLLFASWDFFCYHKPNIFTFGIGHWMPRNTTNIPRRLQRDPISGFTFRFFWICLAAFFYDLCSLLCTAKYSCVDLCCFIGVSAWPSRLLRGKMEFRKMSLFAINLRLKSLVHHNLTPSYPHRRLRLLAIIVAEREMHAVDSW